MTGFGGVYPVAWNVYDDTGALADAATVTLTITLPDGTTVTPTVTNPPTVTGEYRYAYQTTMAGRHTGHAVTASPVTVYDFEFDVEPTPWCAIVSLADAKQQLNIDPADTSDDDELRAYVAGVTGALEQYKHETIVRQQLTEEVELGYGASRFRLWSVPVISLVSVVSWDGSVTWDVSQMRVSAAGVVKVMAGPRVYGVADVTLIAGYQVVPVTYRRGALVMLQHLWETQRGRGTVMSGVIGVEEPYRHPGGVFTGPNKVKEWGGPPPPGGA